MQDEHEKPAEETQQEVEQPVVEEVFAESTETQTDVASEVPKDDYQETDVFAWANNLVQYVDDLKIDLYLFSKNYVPYKTKLAGAVSKQLRPLFIDDILEFILGGVEKGLVVRGFEAAESEENVLQYTRVTNVDKLTEVLNFIKTQKQAIELFD